MGSPPFAFSVHHFINSVGADAGFASIIGLAILILLYFAQARETASLRAHAWEAAERIQQLEAQLAQLPRSQSAPSAHEGQAFPGVQAAAEAGRPAVAASAAGGTSRSPAQQPAFAGVPSPPAGVAAPALSAATKLIPTVAPAAAAASGVALSGDAPGAIEARRAADPTGPIEARRAVDATAVASAPPATVAGGANGSSHEQLLPPRTVSAANSPPRIQMRPGATIPPGRRAAPPLRGRDPQRSGGSRKLVVVLLGAVAVVGVAAALLILTRSSGNSNSGSTQSSATNAPGNKHVSRQATFDPASVTVAVLNGTSTNGLARTIGTKLAGAGYKEGNIATATDQTHRTTVVAYLPGFKQDALQVAKRLKLTAASVQPVDQSAQQLGCPQPGACSANVIVTVGSDLSTQ